VNGSSIRKLRRLALVAASIAALAGAASVALSAAPAAAQSPAAPLVTLSAPATPTATPNGWYWPTNHIVAAPAPGWLQYRPKQYSLGPAWHLAWDDVLTYKHPVYSLAWGRVVISRMDISGYGPGGGKGGAMVVRYRTADGKYFNALFGHIVIDLKKFPVGRIVSPGELLATLNNYKPAHLHFGIHLGVGDPKPLKTTPAKLRGTVGMLMGHSYEYTKNASGTLIPQTYGFVDPAGFLLKRKPWVAPPRILTAPVPPSRTVTTGCLFETSGTLCPAVASGGHTVVLQMEHLEKGRWVMRAKLPTTSATLTTSRTAYRAATRFSRTGSWRIRSMVTGDMDFATKYSAWTSLTVH
jgi:hypothetical protein